MPRPEDSKLRRILMQSIMWIVLASTIGVAALVDSVKLRKMHIPLDEPIDIDGFSIRPPMGWTVHEGEDDSIVMLLDPEFGRQLYVHVYRRSLADMFTGRKEPWQNAGRGTKEALEFQDGTGEIIARPRTQYDGDTLSIINARRSLPNGNGYVQLQMYGPPVSTRRAAEADTDLIKRVISSIQFK